MPALRIRSKSNFDNSRHLFRRFYLTSSMFRIDRSASWSVQIVNWDRSRFDFTNWKAYTAARSSLCVQAFAYSALFNDPYQYPSETVGPLGCSCKKMTPLTWHKLRCQAYNVRQVLVMPMLVVTAVDVVASWAPRPGLVQSSNVERRVLFQCAGQWCDFAYKIR